jgi:lipopolysaccharide export system protein LptA
MGNNNQKGIYGPFPGALFCVCFLLTAVCCLLSASFSFAEEKKAAAKAPSAITSQKNAPGVKAPTVITAQILTADNKAKTALFEGAVVAKKGEMTLYADKMLVFYGDENGDDSSNIKKIDAEGNVKLLKGERVVTAKYATYFAEPEEHTIFTGEPRATEGDNVVTGTKMIYFMSDDRSIVENSKVFLANKEKQPQAKGPK